MNADRTNLTVGRRWLAEGLHVDEAFVEAAMGDELLVGAALDDGAAVHDDDFVGMADGG